MNTNPTMLKYAWALLLALFFIGTDSALATPTFGTRLNNWCAMQPIQAVAPQQSRPYQASGSSCLLCHNTNNPSGNDLNARGSTTASCSGSGTGTVCGTAVNPYCVATAPSNAVITAPPVGTSVAQGQSVTYTAANATNPDGFPLSYTWLFSGGLPNAIGQSVSALMSVAGNIVATLQVRNSVGMLATGTPPTRSVTVTGAANQAPVATITAPAANVTIAQGGSVNFQGMGTDPDNNLPLTYSWSFPGGSPATSTAQNPGSVTYNTAGTYTASFTVTDSLGLASTTVTRIITVTAANQAPSATITAPAANVTIAQGGTVNFQGMGTDPDNNLPLTYAWSFPGGSPASSTAQNPGTVTYNTAGTYTASFTVTDSLGLPSTTVTRTVTVTAANQAPSATITAPAANVTIAQGGTVNFQGMGSDPDNNLPLTYAWSFPGGTPASSTAQNPGTVTYNTAGTYTASFTVTDSLGLPSATVTRTVTVTGANQAPSATISAPAANVTIAQGGTVNFQGMGSDPDNNLPLTYAWSFPGGTPASSTAQNPGTVTYATAGTYTASFTVTDSLGLSSTTVTRTVTVTGTAQQPTARIDDPRGNVTIAQGRSVEFQGSVLDSEANRPFTYLWTFQGGTPASSTRQDPGKVRFATAGIFTVAFTVTNRLGVASPPATMTVTVTGPNQVPVATISAPAANVAITQGATVNFQGMGSDPDNNLPLTYSWSFPGGTPASSTAQNPGNVTYSTPGTFTASFTVTDSRGLASATVTRTITVAAANQAPSATISAPAANVTIVQGGSVNFQGMGSDPDNNLPLTYAWSFPGGTPASSTAQNPGSVTYSIPGTYTASFTVTDSRGLASATVSRTVTVTATPPLATIDDPRGNVTIVQGKSVEFQGTGRDPGNNGPLTYLWTFPGGTPASSTQQDPGKVRFDTPGTYTVSFIVTNSLGVASAPVTLTVTVSADQRPVATIVKPAINVSVLPGGTVNFEGAGSDPGNQALSYKWKFPEGSPSDSKQQKPGAVTFRKVGRFTATLTVTNANGDVSPPVTRTITVAPPNQARIRLDDDCSESED